LVESKLHYQKQIGDSYLDVFCGDAKDYLELLENDSIHLVVTSPPYNCNVKYDEYYDDKEINEYREWLTETFAKVRSKVVPVGYNEPILLKNS